MTMTTFTLSVPCTPGVNLLNETKDKITSCGKTPDDIIFIGSEESGHQCSWSEFCVLANFQYDSSYGAAKIATDLTIVFSDGSRMFRGEYDGSEWWEYFANFTPPLKALRITSLGGNVWWEKLEEINK